MPGTVQELASMFRKAIDSQGNVSLSGALRRLGSARVLAKAVVTRDLVTARHFVFPPLPLRFSTWAS